MLQHEFETLAPRLRQAAVQTVAALGGSDDEAQDVAQDVLLKLWSLREQLTAETCRTGLAAIIARRLWLNEMRHSAQQVRVELMEEDAALTTADAEQTYTLREMERWVEVEMERLPTSEMLILRMRQMERRETSEIARLLDLQERSVQTLLARARRRLLDKLKKL